MCREGDNTLLSCNASVLCVHAPPHNLSTLYVFMTLIHTALSFCVSPLPVFVILLLCSLSIPPSPSPCNAPCRHHRMPWRRSWRCLFHLLCVRPSFPITDTTHTGHVSLPRAHPCTLPWHRHTCQPLCCRPAFSVFLLCFCFFLFVGRHNDDDDDDGYLCCHCPTPHARAAVGCAVLRACRAVVVPLGVAAAGAAAAAASRLARPSRSSPALP